MQTIIGRQIVLSLLILVFAAIPVSAQPADTSFILSADVSYLEQLEANGVVYRENGVEDDLLAILSRNGINTIRLRLWHTPADGWNDLESTLRMAERVRDAGLNLLLDFHYSDTWADPAHQAKPAAWEGLAVDALRDSLYTYTHRVMTLLKERNAMPAYVQVGNEISQGFLWNDGRVGGSFNNGTRWSYLRLLINDASRAIRDVAGDAQVQIIVHTDHGGDVEGATWFFDNLTYSEVDFDIVGLSYYPWWHGTLEDMEHTINTVAERFEKPVLIAETAYMWTLQWYDNTNNLVGLPEHVLPAYDDLPDAQYRFLRDLVAKVRDIPGGRGAGVSYWAPEFIAVSGVGSVWENMTWFDDNGELLPAIRAFGDGLTVGVERSDLEDAVPAFEAYPNPFVETLQLVFENPTEGEISISIYDTLGRERIRMLQGRWLPAGTHRMAAAGVSGLPAGLYLGAIKSRAGQRVIPLIKAP